MGSLTPNLTEGCLATIMTGADVESPIMQILGSKKITGASNSERYRLLVSDGKYVNSFAMLATQLNEKHARGELSEFTVVKIDRYITSMVNNSGRGDKRVLIILGITPLVPGSKLNKKIGNPQQLPDNPVPGRSTDNGHTAPSTASTSMKPSNSPAKNQSMNSTIMGDHLTHPIASLSPYQNKWVIKARVTNKSGIRTWSKPSGDGKLFSMDLLDESGEIRATAFKNEVDKFYDMIEVDKIYYISKCQLKTANKQFNHLKNDYEMTFTSETMVSECHEDNGIPQAQFNLVPISDLANKEAGAIVDIIGVCKDATEVNSFVSKNTGRELRKREVTLVDSSNASIALTLWGNDADNFDGSLQPIVLIKGGKIGEYAGGKSISVFANSTLKINPDVTEAHKLRGWFDNGGCANEIASLSIKSGAGGNFNTEWMTFRESKLKQLGGGDKPDYFMCKAVVHLVMSGKALYKACPQTDCNKKVLDQENGQYRCEKCNQDFPNFKYRLLMNVNLGDWSGSKWVTVFTDLAETMLGKTSQEIGEEIEYNKEAAQTIFSSIHFKSFIFKLRSKMEFYGDSSRIKTTAMSGTPLVHKEYNAHLIKSIREMTGVQSA